MYELALHFAAKMERQIFLTLISAERISTASAKLNGNLIPYFGKACVAGYSLGFFDTTSGLASS